MISLLKDPVPLTQARRSFTVNYTSPNGPFATCYPALAALPFILDSRPAYHRLGNAFLVARGLALWGPENRGNGPESRVPAPRSIHSYAQWLANFLEWAELRGVNLVSCDYATHVAGRYQTEMLQGLWSRDGAKRSPNTANLRVGLACDFLKWMADTGRRGPFAIPYVTVSVQKGTATSSIGHRSFDVQVRQGKARPVQRSLSMPPDAAVNKWLAGVYEMCGPAEGLMCETVLLTAMRREEVVCLRTDVLPDDPSHWVIANPIAPSDMQQVRITICFGTKGRSYGVDHGDKVGPERSILIPLPLAKKWHQYRRSDRNAAFAKLLAGVKGPARAARAREAVHLFLRTEDGARFKGNQLYSIWTSVDLPIEGWSPHDGRHWWACSVLWRELKSHEQIRHANNETAAALLERTALGIIKLQIQPQLGHADEGTTMLYLRWVMDMLRRPMSLEGDAESAHRFMYSELE